VPPLVADIRSVLDGQHPFHGHADVQLFLAWQGLSVVGRIAAVVNRAHNDFHGDDLGFFGLFETVDDGTVAGALLAAAEGWLHERGRSEIQGPFNLSTNDELSSPGVLVEGFDSPPAIMMGHSPAYYARLLEESGFSPVKDLVCYWVDRAEAPPQRLVRALERGMARHGLSVRPIDLKRMRQDVAAIEEVYNSAWERNWGFVPMTPAEIAYMAKHLRPVVRSELCLLEFSGEEPVAFLLALPDYNQALRHLDGRLLPFGVIKLLWYRRRIDTIRVVTLGVKPEYRHQGVDAMLMARVFEGAAKLGMAEGECSWILEDNWVMRRGIERVGGSIYKTYRVYGKALKV
jgi:GNAT superfamily N-acetyltransferase